ncbi:MAG: class I SAM-dependent methyltransferase [Nanoarchaeota archaeon]|nr:class I SAM-dependent methyltransferase [Nanoarchaeota archaeon]
MKPADKQAETPSQQQVWNNIAEEWHQFKEKPSENVIDFLKGKKGNILDLGSGSGRHLVKLKDAKFYLADFSEEMIKLAKKKAEEKNIEAEFFVGDISKEKTPFKDNFFDYAIFIAALHCIKGEKARQTTLKELFRVLKPRALALVNVWNKDSSKFKNKKKESLIKWRDKGVRYYYFYTQKELNEELTKAGFRIKTAYEPGTSISFIVEKSDKR